MPNVQIWLSVNANIINLVEHHTLHNIYTPIGNIVNNRMLARIMVNSDGIDNIFSALQMCSAQPYIIGIQNVDGTNFDSILYPKDIVEFNKYMQPIAVINNGISTLYFPSDNTSSGWKPFQQ